MDGNAKILINQKTVLQIQFEEKTSDTCFTIFPLGQFWKILNYANVAHRF